MLNRIGGVILEKDGVCMLGQTACGDTGLIKRILQSKDKEGDGSAISGKVI